MFCVFLADTDKSSIQALTALLQKVYGLTPEIWQGSSSYHAFLENPQSKIVLIRVDDPSIQGLSLTKAAVVRENTHIVWMANSDAYAVDAFRYGAEAYMLLPAAEESLRDVMNTLGCK